MGSWQWSGVCYTARMTKVDLLEVLFPHFAGISVERVADRGALVRITAASTQASARCPSCGYNSSAVHSGYERTVADTAVGGRRLVIELTVRRFFCRDATCPKKTFAEQIPGLTYRYGRDTLGLRRVHEAVGLALGGRAGSRLTERLAVPLSRDALIRRIRALPDPPVGEVSVLGVDDFALLRGHVYGTVLVDVLGRRPVDVLPERSAEALRAWLDAHPGVEVICRDRASCYAEGAALGAPTATQVADRWHLWHNLCQAVEKAVARLRPGWIPVVEPAESAGQEAPRLPDTPGAARARALHAQIHGLKDRGVGPYLIARELRIDPKTVHRYLSFATDEDLLGQGRRQRATGLDAHADYLARRYAEGARGGVLHKELESRGVKVSERTVRRFTARFHTEQPARPAIPKVRDVITLVTTHPDKRTAEDTVLLKELCARCPDLELLCAQVRRFAAILLTRPGAERLAEWIAQAQAAELKETAAFAAGLLADWDAVAAAATLKWSSGSTEGQVNRIKMLKRQMFGRAKPDLLRKRVLARN